MAEQGTARTRGEEGGQPGTWPGLRDAKPKRSEEFGVGGDRAPSNSVFVKCRGRKIEGAERDSTKECPKILLEYSETGLGLRQWDDATL